MDFTTGTEIGARINNEVLIFQHNNDQDEQLAFAKGYDHNWVLRKDSPNHYQLAAQVEESSSGRILQVFTTEPGVQFYTGNFLDGSKTGKNNKVYQFRYGFCLETQHFPDSPNHDNFPTTVLKPGQEYHSRTAFKFSTV